MSKPNSNGKDDEPLRVMQDDIRDIRNDIERIKSDTHNINRIMTISNITHVINDLKNIIGNSDLKAAVLYLTKEKISAQELAAKLKIDPKNLTKFVSPFTDKKSYITELKEGRSKFFQRADIVDLIGFEQQEAFAPMIESWKGKQTQIPPTVVEQKDTSEQNKENTSTDIQG